MLPTQILVKYRNLEIHLFYTSIYLFDLCFRAIERRTFARRVRVGGTNVSRGMEFSRKKYRGRAVLLLQICDLSSIVFFAVHRAVTPYGNYDWSRFNMTGIAFVFRSVVTSRYCYFSERFESWNGGGGSVQRNEREERGNRSRWNGLGLVCGFFVREHGNTVGAYKFSRRNSRGSTYWKAPRKVISGEEDISFEL